MKLYEYTENFLPMIQNYQLTPQQLQYTGTPDLPIKFAQSNAFIHPILGISDNHLTNFLVLDEKKDVASYTTNEQALLLRTFSTDQRYLRNGYAKTVLELLPDFVQEQFPNVNEIILAVNEQNFPAQKLYEQAGYRRIKDRVSSEYGLLYVMSLCLFN